MLFLWCIPGRIEALRCPWANVEVWRPFIAYVRPPCLYLKRMGWGGGGGSSLGAPELQPIRKCSLRCILIHTYVYAEFVHCQTRHCLKVALHQIKWLPGQSSRCTSSVTKAVIGAYMWQWWLVQILWHLPYVFSSFSCKLLKWYVTVCFLGRFVNGRYHTACRYSGPMAWNSASVTFLKICYYGRQLDLIWCNDTLSMLGRVYKHSYQDQI